MWAIEGFEQARELLSPFVVEPLLAGLQYSVSGVATASGEVLVVR